MPIICLVFAHHSVFAYFLFPLEGLVFIVFLGVEALFLEEDFLADFFTDVLGVFLADFLADFLAELLLVLEANLFLVEVEDLVLF